MDRCPMTFSLGMQEARAIESLQADVYLQIKVHAVSEFISDLRI